MSAMNSTPPVAKRVDTTREFHGDVFNDPYEWLRDKADAEVIGYLEAENTYTDAVTAHLEPLQQKIFDEIKARTKETDLSVPTRRGDYWYYGRSFEGKQYGVHCRCVVHDLEDWIPPTFDEHTEVPGRGGPARREHRGRRPRLLQPGCGDGEPGRVDPRVLRRHRRRRALYVAVQELTDRPALRRRDCRHLIGCDLGCGQQDDLLHDRGRRMASRYRVAAPVGQRSARGEGVPRTGREVLARCRPYPQRQVRDDRCRFGCHLARPSSPTPAIPTPSSPVCCRAAKGSSTPSSTP